MKMLSCRAVWRRMSAFCDGELALDGQIAVEGHLQTCPACRAEIELTRDLGRSLRARSHALVELGGGLENDLDALGAAVLPRIRAERSNALVAQVRGWFDDMQLVSIAAGGIAFMIVCTLMLFATMSNMMHGSGANPDSLAALFETLSRESPMRAAVSAQSFVPPRVFSDATVAAVVDHQGSEDAVFAFAARVSREGNVSGIEWLVPIGADTANRSALEDRIAGNLLAAASAARFAPARQGGAPVSTDVVWMLTHTTVRGTLDAREPVPDVPAGARPVGSVDAPDAEPVADIQLYRVLTI